MSQLDIKSAVSLGDAATVPSLGPVTLKSVFPQRSGISTKTGEPYCVQDGLLADATGEVRCSFWDQPDLSVLRGATRVFHSVKAKNGRLSGIGVKVGHDKDGANRWEIHFSKAVVITEPAAAEVVAPVVAPVVAAAVTVPDPLPGSIAEKVQEQAKVPTHDKMADLVALFRHCYGETLAIIPEGSLCDGAALQAVQAGAATLFIAAKNSGLDVGAHQRYSQPDKNPEPSQAKP